MGDEDPMDLGDDLFGDEEEDAGDNVRQLDDEELDSGDDEIRNDREAPRPDDDEDTQNAMAELSYVEKSIAIHQIPKPCDGEVSTYFTSTHFFD